MSSISRAAQVLVLTASLFASTANAQILGGHVTRDPSAGTVTYTFDIQGPANGSAQIWVSGALCPTPLPVGPFGDLYLDPAGILPLPNTVPLDPSGNGYSAITVPENLTAGIPFTFQTVNVVPFGSILAPNAVVLSDNGIVLGQTIAPRWSLDLEYAYGTADFTLCLTGSGMPGTTVENCVAGAGGVQRAGGSVVIPANGKFALNINVPGGLNQNDDVLILTGGQVIEQINLFK